jgi:phage-related protein (TIGR01555 family)
MPRVGVKGLATRLNREADKAKRRGGRITTDSFQNFVAQVGIGTDNLSSGSTYGFNPITRNRILLEWIHRGSWAGGLAVNVVADDMTREGVKFVGDLGPEQQQELHEAAVGLDLWGALNEATMSARLYGGSVLIPLIDGQDMSQPFNAERVGSGQLKGFLPLDRWQVDPSLEDLVQELGPHYGLPKYYRVNSDAPGLRGVKVHYTRVLRQIGDKLPYWQRVMENMWGTSVYERMYDRLVAFDSTTQGAAQLIYKIWLRTLKIDGLREIVSSGGKKMEGLAKYVDMFRRFQAFEGVTMIDAKDDLTASEHNAIAGLADAMTAFAEQLAGAIQVPLTRLLGRSPGGMNSTGDSDLKTYYDGILQKQKGTYQVPVTRFYRMIAASHNIDLPQGFRIEFNPLWQLSDEQQADVASKDVDTITKALESGVINLPIAARELKQLSEITGRLTNVTDEWIEELEEAEQNPPGSIPLPETDKALATLGRGSALARDILRLKGPDTVEGEIDRAFRATQDAASAVAELGRRHNLQIVVENTKGSVRSGKDWSVTMPADYGYIRKTMGADGDQLDCYIGPDPNSDQAWVVHQNDPDTGQYDEDKVLLGFKTKGDALACYLQGHSRSLDAFGSIEPITIEQLQKLTGEKA